MNHKNEVSYRPVEPGIKVKKGYAVKFPKILLEEFKRAFPSAQWVHQNIEWEIGPRSEKRLLQWIDIVKEVLESLDKKEELEFTESEIQELLKNIFEKKNQINQYNSEIQRSINSKGSFSEALSLLKQNEQILDRIAGEAKAAKAAEKQAKEEVKQRLGNIVDLPEILTAQQTMARSIGQFDATSRNKFDKAQGIIKRERDTLKQAGLASIGIDKLASANFNRPDRDHPKFVTEDDIFIIREIPVD